jgi:hypothetical protein
MSTAFSPCGSVSITLDAQLWGRLCSRQLPDGIRRPRTTNRMPKPAAEYPVGAYREERWVYAEVGRSRFVAEAGR